MEGCSVVMIPKTPKKYTLFYFTWTKSRLKDLPHPSVLKESKSLFAAQRAHSARRLAPIGAILNASIFFGGGGELGV